MSSERKNPLVRWGTFLLFGLLVLSFMLWGIGDIFRGGGRLTVIAKVGDREISAESYADAVRREINSLQANANYGLTREQLLALGVGQRALTPLLQQALLAELADDMGLVVTEQMLLDSIAREAAFQRNGRFDQATYVQTLRQAGLTEDLYLWLLAAEIRRNMLFRPAGESVVVPESEAKLLFDYIAERRVAQYLEIANESIVDLPQPGDAELQQVYEDYPAEFEAPEYRAVTLLHLTPEDLFEEIAVTEADARARFDATPEQYQEPERRALSQIIFDGREAAEAALAEAQGGKALAEIASDNGTSVANIALQSQNELGAVLPELAEAAFALPAGESFGVAETVLGYHLFQVTQIEARQERSFEEVKDGIIEALRLEQARAALGDLADQIEAELATGATLEETAEKLQLRLREIASLDDEGLDRSGAPVEDLPSPAQVLPQIFAAETGIESPFGLAPDGSYFAFRVDGVTPPSVKPFAEVQDQVRALWERQAGARLAKEKAEALAQQINEGGRTLDQIASEEGLTLQTTEPLHRYEENPATTPSSALPPALFDAAQGKAVTAASDRGVLVAVLTEIRPADAAAETETFARVREDLNRRTSNDFLDQALRSLQHDYPVEINQQAIQQVLDSF